MGRKCCVPGCKSGYYNSKEKLSIFVCPNDEEILAKWRRSIPRGDRLFTVNDVVCHKHFREDDIVREKVLGVVDGRVIQKVKLQRPRLRKGAVPRIFPHCSNSRTTQPVSQDVSSETNVTVDVDPLDIKTECSVDFTSHTGAELGFVIKEEIDCTSCFSFEDLCNSLECMEMPSKSWAVHQAHARKSSYVVFNEVTANDDTSKPTIFSIKQVCINNQLEVTYSVLGQALAKETVVKAGLLQSLADKSFEDMKELVETFHRLCVCEGGPSINDFSDFSPMCAVKDPTRKWRHVHCPLLLVTSLPVCERCSALVGVLKLHARRLKNMPKQLKRVKVNVVLRPERRLEIEKVKVQRA